ncbi:M48 family metalloprotease, partial [bacterium]|nr:M48 family metalloprotease [bacterium]
MTRRLALGLLLTLVACGGSLRQMKKGMEADFARSTYRSMRDAGALHDDPVLNGLVRNLGRRLDGPARAKRRVDYSWHVLEWEIPNAFNAGDGYTFLTTGLLRWAESTDEVAMIMGHEAAHTADGHITEAIGDMMAENLFIGVIAIAVGGKAANFAQILSSLRNLSYGREHEYVSDRMGARFSWAGGYNPHYATTFFQRLRENGRELLFVPNGGRLNDATALGHLLQVGVERSVAGLEPGLRP